MRKFTLVLLLVFCALCAFAKEYRGMYVNSREGLNVRKSPSMSAEKIQALKYGEYIGVVEEGEIVTIDGIKARWAKIIIDHDGNDAADDYNNYGWGFGGYLQDKCPMSESEILDYLKRLSKTEEDWLGTDYFPENRYREYLRGKVWECPVFKKVLPNYDCNYFEHETNKEVVAICDCLVYWEPRAAAAYGALRFAKAGTKFKLWRVDDWGIDSQTKTLFPIYETDEHLLVRGIDVTGSDCVSRASDGKGGFHSLVYQPILEGISIDDVHNNVESADCSTTHEELEQYFSSNSVYERRWRSGGFNVNFAEHINPKGKRQAIRFMSKANRFKLLFPLNMKKPVPIVQELSFVGGTGRERHSMILMTIEPDGDGEQIGNYVYFNSESGSEGLGYCYFDDTNVYMYRYQSDDNGTVTSDGCYFEHQSEGDPYDFRVVENRSGEPKGKNNAGSFRKGKYCNPVCRLKLRKSPGLGGEKINTIEGGTLLQVLETGKEATIDGYASNWVKVKAVNKERFVEGYEFTQSGWVFGAYLE